jgi:hypothetical protein
MNDKPDDQTDPQTSSPNTEPVNPTDTTDPTPESSFGPGSDPMNTESANEGTGAPAETRVPSPQPIGTTALPINKPKKSKKWLVWVLIVLLLAAAGAGAYYYFMVMNKPTEQTNNNVAQEPEAAKNAAELIQRVRDAGLKGEAVEVVDKLEGRDAEEGFVYTVAAYQPTEYKFKSNPVTAEGLGTTGDETVTGEDYALFGTVLAENNLEKQAKEDGTVDSESSKSDLYLSDTMVCYVAHYLTDATSRAGVGCADVSSYVTAAKENQVFYDAYVKANAAATEGLVVSSPEIEDGLENHKRALVHHGAFFGLYYQEPSKDWVFLLGGQDTPACSAFDTEVVQKAFNDYACYDEATKKTSKVTAA